MSVDDALEYLAGSADDVAQSHFLKARNEEMKKIVKAELMRASNLKTGAEREAFAMASPEYKAIIEDYAASCRRVEYHRAKRAWAEAQIEIWRTTNANARAAERVR